ncbi:2'-5' RNA ligase family protein [Caulobacter sp. LARHSG274]
MPDQFSLFAPEPATDRLFFAIFPDPATAGAIAEQAGRLRTAHQLTGRSLAAERFHITLHHLGDHAGLRRDLVAMAGEAAQALAATPFQVTFDRAVSFHNGGNNPLVLRGDAGLEALKTFQRDLGLAMARAGLGRWVDKAFTPHVTLLYDRRVVAEVPAESVTWTVNGFTLVRSLLGRTEHVPLARWALD